MANWFHAQFRWKNQLLNFCCGLIIGVFICYLFNNSFNWMNGSCHCSMVKNGCIINKSNISNPHITKRMFQSTLQLQFAVKNPIVELISKKVRLFCLIVTVNDPDHMEKSINIRNSWAKRCNKFLFMSNVTDPSLPSINLNVCESLNCLWGKTKAAFKYVHDNYINDFDWFMKADDDTYVIVENLRYFLLSFDRNEASFHGSPFEIHNNYTYMDGGPGYVLSHKALKLFVEFGLKNSKICSKRMDGPEDVEISRCLSNLGVKMSDSRDNKNRHRFMHYQPKYHLIPGYIRPESWFANDNFYPSEIGMNCCSNHAISFHYVSAENMYIMDYFIYHLEPFGQCTNFLNTIGQSVGDSRQQNEKEILDHVTKLAAEDVPAKD